MRLIFAKQDRIIILIDTYPGCYELNIFFTLSEVFLWTMQLLSISGKSLAARKGHVAANFSET